MSLCVRARQRHRRRRTLSALPFEDGREFNFYACAIKAPELAGTSLEKLYDWRADVMSELWKPALALKKLRAVPDKLACNALLDQNIFSEVGNIIKNEVLFRLRIQQLSQVGALSPAKLRAHLGTTKRRSFYCESCQRLYKNAA